jgi:hypothetical protein
VTPECPDDPALLVDLRGWAWSLDRTDVVLDLDLHDEAWAFQRSPSRSNLVRLASVMPVGRLGGWAEAEVRHLVAAGGTQQELGHLRDALEAWSACLCAAVKAHIDFFRQERTEN